MAKYGKTSSLEHLNNDVLLVICSQVSFLSFQTGEKKNSKTTAIKMLSMTNHFFRELTSPTVFRHIKISGEWDKASPGLQTFVDNPATLRDTHSLEFRVIEGRDDLPTPVKDAPDRLMRVLNKFPMLENLAIILPYSWTNEFDLAFERAWITMPAVNNLVVGFDCHFAIRHCPNVETVTSFP